MNRLRMRPESHLVDRIGWLRAAVLGANDGIVSTASLIVGVAAATTTPNAVLIEGVAGLVAGAMSMAAGEYVSVSSAATFRAEVASALIRSMQRWSIARRTSAVGTPSYGMRPSPEQGILRRRSDEEMSLCDLENGHAARRSPRGKTLLHGLYVASLSSS
jgi:hypothetical protein